MFFFYLFAELLNVPASQRRFPKLARRWFIRTCPETAEYFRGRSTDASTIPEIHFKLTLPVVELSVPSYKKKKKNE